MAQPGLQYTKSGRLRQLKPMLTTCCFRLIIGTSGRAMQLDQLYLFRRHTRAGQRLTADMQNMTAVLTCTGDTAGITSAVATQQLTQTAFSLPIQ